MPTTEGFLSAKTKDIEFCLKRETTMKSLRDCYTLSLLIIYLLEDFEVWLRGIFLVSPFSVHMLSFMRGWISCWLQNITIPG